MQEKNPLSSPAFFSPSPETNPSVVFNSSQNMGQLKNLLKGHNKSWLIRESSQPGPYISVTYKTAEDTYLNQRFAHTEWGWVNAQEYRGTQQCGLLHLAAHEALDFGTIKAHLQNKKAYYPEEPESPIIREREAETLSAVLIAWRGSLYYSNFKAGQLIRIDLPEDLSVVWEFAGYVERLPSSQCASGPAAISAQAEQVQLANEHQLNMIARLTGYVHHESLGNTLRGISAKDSGHELFKVLSNRFDMNGLLLPSKDQASNNKDYGTAGWRGNDWGRYHLESKKESQEGEKELPRPRSPAS